MSPENLEAAAARVREELEEGVHVTISKTESIVRFRTSADDEKLSALLREMVTSGDKVSQFREVAGDLEEAFVSATREANSESTRPEEPAK